MSVHEYICPTFGVTLQAARDVSGLKVRCQCCQAAFIANAGGPAPAVVTRLPKPVRRTPAEEADPPAPYLQPLPRTRKIPDALFDVAAVLVCAIGLTVFGINRFKSAVDERDKTAQAAKPEKAKASTAKAKNTKSDPTTVAKAAAPPVVPVVAAARTADCRIVDNGEVVTTAGVSAGIDGALHVVERLIGKPTAEDTALYMEYQWKGGLRKE